MTSVPWELGYSEVTLGPSEREFHSLFGANVDAAQLEQFAEHAVFSESALHLAFWYAAKRLRFGVARILLDRGAHPDTTSLDIPVLWMCVGAGGGLPKERLEPERKAFCEELIRRGANVDALGLGRTALYQCSFLGHVESARFLLEHGADANLGHPPGESPLHGAAGEARNEIVRLLLENGADVNYTCFDGCTALHCVVEGDADPETVRLLLDAGAITTIHWRTESYPLKRGVTPLQIAKRRKLARIVELLEQEN